MPPDEDAESDGDGQVESPSLGDQERAYNFFGLRARFDTADAPQPTAIAAAAAAPTPRVLTVKGLQF